MPPRRARYMGRPPPHRPDVPAGYQFAPTPEELVENYLNPWIAGQPVDHFRGIVPVDDVYFLRPATLTERRDDGQWYFLCVNSWEKGKNGRVVNRRVEDGGAWRPSPPQRGAAGWQSFEYIDSLGNRTGWRMEEFTSDLEEAADDEGVKVLCKVYHSPMADEEPQESRVGCKRQREEEGETQESKRREGVGSSVFPAPVEIECAAGDGCSDAAGAGASPAASPSTAWLLPLLEIVSRPVHHYGGVAIKVERQEPLVMQSADQAAVPIGDAVPNDWVDMIFDFNRGAGSDDGNLSASVVQPLHKLD